MRCTKKWWTISGFWEPVVPLFGSSLRKYTQGTSLLISPLLLQGFASNSGAQEGGTTLQYSCVHYECAKVRPKAQNELGFPACRRI